MKANNFLTCILWKINCLKEKGLLFALCGKQAGLLYVSGKLRQDTSENDPFLLSSDRQTHLKGFCYNCFMPTLFLIICCSPGEFLELPGPTIQALFGTLWAGVLLEPSITSFQLTPTPVKWCENRNILHSSCPFSGTCWPSPQKCFCQTHPCCAPSWGLLDGNGGEPPFHPQWNPSSPFLTSK